MTSAYFLSLPADLVRVIFSVRRTSTTRVSRMSKRTDLFFQSQIFHLHSVDTVESDEIQPSALERATQKCTELIEQLTEIDDLFLNDALPSTEKLAAAIPIPGERPSLSTSCRFSWENTAVQHRSMASVRTSRVPQSVRSSRTISRSQQVHRRLS